MKYIIPVLVFVLFTSPALAATTISIVQDPPDPIGTSEWDVSIYSDDAAADRTYYYTSNPAPDTDVYPAPSPVGQGGWYLSSGHFGPIQFTTEGVQPNTSMTFYVVPAGVDCSQAEESTCAAEALSSDSFTYLPS